jgi:5'-phosphate synthase pdxT subunit
VSGRFGVLALQGDFAAHAAALRGAGAEVLEVRRCSQLVGLDGLVLPGGESTALLRLMTGEPWFEALRHLHAAGGSLFGSCAGAILLAREVWPAQPSLGLLDIAADRNAWGRQRDSFATLLESEVLGSLEGIFIRAPRLEAPGPEVEVVARLPDGEPVLVRQRRVAAASFHPELTGDARVHRWWVEQVSRAPLGEQERVGLSPS